MKKPFRCVGALILLAGSPQAVHADSVIFSQTEINPDYGYTIGPASNHNQVGGYDQRLADNFSISSAHSISGVDWFGNVLGNLTAFSVAIYAQAGLATNTAVFSQVFNSASVTQSPGRFTDETKYSVQFSQVLPAGAYWLSVSGEDTQFVSRFVWTIASGDSWEALARNNPASTWTPGNWGSYIDGNFTSFSGFAFDVRGGELTTIPLPQGAYMGAAGLAGIGMIRRRRV